MTSFQEAYCAATGCPAAKFRSRIFWRCLGHGSVILAPLFGGSNAAYFSVDRDLISQVGRATTMEQVREEVRDYFHDPRNRTFLRGRLKLRLSTSRLRAIARACLPEGATPDGASPPDFPAESRPPMAPAPRVAHRI